MTPDDYIANIKNRAGSQRAKDGTLIREMDDRELLRRMLERYPGDRNMLVGLDAYLGELPKEIPPSEVEEKLNTPSFQGFFNRVKQSFGERQEKVHEQILPQTEGKPLLRGLGVLGQGAALVADVGIGAVAEALEPGVKEGIKKGFGAVATSPLGERVREDYGAFKEARPDAALAVESVGNLAGVLPIGLAAKPAVAGVSRGIKTALEGGDAATRAGAQGIKAGAQAVAPAVKSVVQAPGKALSATRSWFQQPTKASVETVLRETPVLKFDEYVKIARDATKSNKAFTPLEHAGVKAQEALNQMQRKLNTVGKNKSAVLESSVGRKPVGNIVVKFRQDLNNALKRKTSVEGDKRIYRDIEAEAARLGDNPSAREVDKFVDFVQSRIYTGKRDLSLPVTDDVEKILRPITGKLNAELKKQLPSSYSTLNDQYAKMVRIVNELNQKLGLEGEKGGALMKRVFSPSDANTKQLFAEVLDETGIDLVNEATLARYVMDVLGDARQKSMLEQLNLSVTKPTAGTLTTRFLDYVVDRFNTPEALIRRAREMTDGGIRATP